MNRHHSAGTFTPREERFIRVVHSITKSISHTRFMEAVFSTLAIAYGLSLLGFGASVVKPFDYETHLSILHAQPRIYGALILAFGVLGLHGMMLRWRKARLVASCALALLWGGLALNFGTAHPPLIGGFISYGFDSVMEAVIFVRVYADLDGYWKT